MADAELPVAPRRLRFPKAARVVHRRDFDRVRAARQTIRDEVLRIGYRLREDTADAPARLGLAVGRKLGRAPHRNRIKRVVREAFRLAPGRFPDGFDLVVMPLDREAAADFDRVRRSLDGIARRLRRRLRQQAAEADG